LATDQHFASAPSVVAPGCLLVLQTWPLRSPQSGIGAFRNHVSLVFRNCSQDVNGEPVRLWEIDGNEINIRFHQTGNTVNVSFQPVNFCYQELGAMNAA
jgi:hypothetical protein